MSDEMFPWRRKEWLELRKDFDGLVARVFGEEAKKDLMTFSPAIDVTETDNDVIVKAEIPGMVKSDLDVTLTGDVLTIKGEKREEKEENTADRHTIERRFGSFTRSVTLPRKVQGDKIQAKYENGVLNLTMPKIESELDSSRKISVE